MRSVALGLFLLAGAGLLVRPARGADNQCSANVWYRADPQCPDGQAFIAKAAQRNPAVRLADAGDQIDFVVTIGLKQALNVGRLERQTQRGTVAIRELAGESCEEIADAFALHLAMAAEQCGEPSAALPAAPLATVTRAPLSAVALRRPQPDATARRTELASNAPSWAGVGSALLLFGAVSPTQMPMFGAFVQRAWPGTGPLRPALRAGVLWGSASLDEFDLALLVGRVELCPLNFGAERYAVRPCLNLDVGRISIEHQATGSGGSDFWVSPGLLMRVEYSPVRPLLIEVQAGALSPITRSERDAGDQFHTGRIGSQLGIGAGVVIP